MGGGVYKGGADKEGANKGGANGEGANKWREKEAAQIRSGADKE